MPAAMTATLARVLPVSSPGTAAIRRWLQTLPIPGQATLIGHWLDGAATPLARVLDKLAAGEQEAFLKAMDLLETELHRQDTHD
jgi:hypothetical protein